MRIKGEFLRQASDPDAAEECFAAALAIGPRDVRPHVELRVGDLARRLWAAQGRKAEARQLLGPVYQAFDEGFGTPDLEDARALLASLEQA